MTTLDLALSYTAAGIPVFPCREVDEETGNTDPATGEVEVLKAKTPRVSNGFKGATTSERVVRILFGERFPTSMVGAPTGEQMGAFVIDIDVHTDDNGDVVNGYHTLAALEAKHGDLPRTAVAKTAGGGEHHYFRYVPGVRNRGKLGDGIDVRGAGGYVIMPGSVLATGAEYTWLDWDEPGLPPVPDAPDWLLELVLPPEDVREATNTDYTYQAGDNSAYVERAVSEELHELAHTSQGGRGEAVNRSAFSLGTLVGAGVLSRTEAEAGLFDAAYANGVVAKDGEKEIRRKIKRGLDAGIKQPRVIPERETDNWPVVDVTRLIENGKAKRAALVPTELYAEPEEAAEYHLDAVGDLESMTTPGGLVEDLIDWITSSAEQPSRPLALAAVLPLVAALAGSRYSTGSRDTRPNIYTVALADSGFGKEHARSQIKRLLMESQGQFDEFSGPARIMSASALREVLEANPSINCQIDEFGGFIRDITDRKAGAHQKAISTDLRDYYSASSTFFEGAAYRGSPPKRIYNPNLCVHGTSTPDQFWTALSSSSAEDGLLPRLVLFYVKGDKPPVVKPQRDVRLVPAELLLRMSRVAGIDVVQRRTGNLSGIVKKTRGPGENKPKIVPWTPDALSMFAAIKHSIDEHEAKVAPEAKPFVRRIAENAIKLAMIVAIGQDPERPVITESILEWAASLSWTCAADMIKEVTARLADNQREANYKLIERVIRDAGTAGISRGILARKVKGIESRQRDDILKDMVDAGMIKDETRETKGRPSKRLYWMW
jgi:hypothetical protein